MTEAVSFLFETIPTLLYMSNPNIQRKSLEQVLVTEHQGSVNTSVAPMKEELPAGAERTQAFLGPSQSC